MVDIPNLARIAFMAFSLCVSLPACADHDSQSTVSNVQWERFGVALDFGQRGAFDERGLESPVVIRDMSGQLTMWYRGRTFRDDIGRIMRAVSEDGMTWTRTGVVSEPNEPYEGTKVDPMSVTIVDDEYWMWYGGVAKGGSANLSRSTDGVRWESSARNPVLKKTARSWDRRGAGGQHSVFWVRDHWEMIYKGYGRRKGWTYYGLATSDDGETWRKQGRRVTPDPDIGESTLFRNPFAFYRDERYYIVHAMSGSQHLNLRLLYSNDGEEWHRAGVVFQKGLTPNGVDEKWATSGSILFEDGRVRMWYEGGDNRGRVRILYAETSEEEFFRNVPNKASSTID